MAGPGSAPYARCAGSQYSFCLLFSHGARSRAIKTPASCPSAVARSSVPRLFQSLAPRTMSLSMGLYDSHAIWMAHCSRWRTTIATIRHPACLTLATDCLGDCAQPVTSRVGNRARPSFCWRDPPQKMPRVVLTGGQHGPLREIIEHGPHTPPVRAKRYTRLTEARLRHDQAP